MNILVVAHQETRTGAPRVLLNLLVRLQTVSRPAATTLVSLQPGALSRDIARQCQRRVLWRDSQPVGVFLVQEAPDVVLVNSCCAHVWASTAARLGIRTVYIIHEPLYFVERVFLESGPPYVPGSTDRLFAVDRTVVNALRSYFPSMAGSIGGVRFSVDPGWVSSGRDDRGWISSLRSHLILGIGDASHHESARRKGLDRFVSVAANYGDCYPDDRTPFVWLGNISEQSGLRRAAGELLLTPGEVPDVRPWLTAARLLLIMSRADPLPLVAVEAMALGTGVLACRGAGELDHLLPPAALVPPSSHVIAHVVHELSAAEGEGASRLGVLARQVYDSRLPYLGPLDAVCAAVVGR